MYAAPFDYYRAGSIGHRLPVSRSHVGVRRMKVELARAPGRQNDSLRLKETEPAALAIVPEGAGNAIAILE